MTERYDEAVAAFWDDVSEYPGGKFAYAARHPVRAWRGLAEVRRLPVLDALPDDSPAGRALRSALRNRVITRRDFWWFGAAVLEIPADPADYTAGRRQQTVRRMLRKAERAGLRCRAVRPDERSALFAVANRHEREHPDPSYRAANPDNDDLWDHPDWRLVVDAEDRPMLLVVAPACGAWAVLRYFRTQGWGPEHTLARWAGTADLVADLSRRGVRHLLDPDHPGGQTPGLRHFQRMLGYRYVRVRVARNQAVPRNGSTKGR